MLNPFLGGNAVFFVVGFLAVVLFPMIYQCLTNIRLIHF
jgi:hypothetical protein